MRAGFTPEKGKRQLKSILLVYMLVASSMLVVFPLSVPKARAQVTHLASAALEDMAGLPYDMSPIGDGVVVWDPNEDHIISDLNGYIIEPGMTLDIPPLNYLVGDPSEHEITFQGFGSRRIDVYGTLITNMDSIMPPTYTAFLGEGFAGWDGIYFHPGSDGRIYDSLLRDAINGVVFEPGSTLISPGIAYSNFEDPGAYGVRMDGALGATNVMQVNFDDGANPSAVNLDVANGSLTVSNTLFVSHGPGLPSLHISNASVIVQDTNFNGDSQPGNVVLIEGGSNGTRLDGCEFWDVATGEFYIQVDGSSNLISNCRFDNPGGARTIIANENASGIPAHPVILNPTSDSAPGSWDDSFDNTTMNATGLSSVTLQWYMDVYVEDPNGNSIYNAPVWVEDRNGDPAVPPSITTDASGWARGFIITELIQYSSSITHFNPFSVSALNDSMMGYASPTMNMSKEITVIVPFNPVPNLPPIVSYIETPLTIQSGLINITFMLSDPNPGDDGNMSITVEFWDPISGWGGTATADPSSDTTNLNNNTLYTFVWDSRAIGNFPDRYSTEITINITPHDRAGPGTPSETLTFTVDNNPPYFITRPTVVLSDTIAYITWTVNELAEASVWYGLDGIFDTEIIGTSGSTDQNVTLTGLRPGRNYTYFINSTDPQGLKQSSDPTWYVFYTEVRIQLRKGWNMISIPPITPSSGLPTVENVLAPIAGLYDAVQAYDLLSDPNDPWKHNRTGKLYGNDLDMIGPPMGLWIHMKQDALLILDHKVPDPTWQDFIQLVQGWNFVGYPSVENRAIDTALAGMPYDMVQTYDAITDQWLSYDGSFGSLTQMEMGRGYWIHATSSYIWQVDYV